MRLLELPGLRARGDLAELRESDLAFTLAEARELLVDRGGLDLTPEQLDVLRERTEGWPAALYLAGLALRDSTETDEAIERFAGDDRFVVDYIREEFLEPVSRRMRFSKTLTRSRRRARSSASSSSTGSSRPAVTRG